MRLVKGRRAVSEILKSNSPVEKILLVENLKPSRIIDEIRHLAGERHLVIETTDRQRLDSLAGGAHQGVAAFMKEFGFYSFDDLLNDVKSEDAPLLLILDHVLDPRNLGAIIRSADAAGVSGVIIPKRRAAAVSTAVHKASAGATAHVKIARVSNLVQAMKRLRDNNIWLAGASADAETLYYQMDLNRPIAMVLGGEGRGLTRLVKQNCDFLVKIPMRGRIDSLNVSVAASLLLFEALKQRDG